MSQIIRIKSISQLLDGYDVAKPKHPLIAVVNLSKVGDELIKYNRSLYS